MLRTYGKNLKNIADRSSWSGLQVCEGKPEVLPSSKRTVMRVDVVKDLSEVRWNTMEIDVMEDNFEIEKILKILC